MEEKTKLMDVETNENEAVSSEMQKVERCTVTSMETQGVEKVKLLNVAGRGNENENEEDEEVFDKKNEQCLPTVNDLDISKEIPAITLHGNLKNNDSTPTVQSLQNRKRSREGKPHVTLQLDIKAAHRFSEKSLEDEYPKQQIPGTVELSKPLKVQVFLKEGEGKLLTLEKGKITTAGEIKKMMLEVLAIPKSASRLFAIWLISPYLELQLKTHHIPYLLRKQWRDMLVEFSSCQNKVFAANDEPVLVFQRNSFCLVKHEIMENDETVIKRLFAEARDNILNAKYPIPTDDAIMLGGILARIELGPYSPDTKPGYLRKNLSTLLPYYAIGSNKIIQQFRGSSVEQQLREQHEHATKKASDVLSCQLKFLEYCRTLPFYGSAFFRGKVLQDQTSWKVWKSSEIDVVICINREGITIIKGVKQENIVHLPYDDLSWEYLKEDNMNAFCIEYDVVDEDGQTVPQQIQIITKQACMMDAMVDSCVNSLNAMNVPKTPTSADYSKLMDLSYSTTQSNRDKHNFSLSRPFKFR